MKHTINLVLGDPSDDGHGKTHRFTFKSNLNDGQVQDAYTRGSEELGVDLVEDVCADYEENLISGEIMEKFFEAGFDKKSFDADLEDEDEDDEEVGSYRVWDSGFVQLYLFMVKLGDPEFKYEEIEPNEIHIGGYGLFH